MINFSLNPPKENKDDSTFFVNHNDNNKNKNKKNIFQLIISFYKKIFEVFLLYFKEDYEITNIFIFQNNNDYNEINKNNSVYEQNSNNTFIEYIISG